MADPLDSPQPAGDVLGTPEAGGKAIRGGVLRIAGYVAGGIAAIASAPFLIRHLGVVDYGRFVTVTTLVTMVGILADAGLTVVAQREFATRDAAARSALLGNIVVVRVAIALVASVGAIGFALAAGFDDVLMAGTLLGCAGMVIGIVQLTYTIPLFVELKLATVTALELLRQLLMVAAILGLVAADASLLPFLSIAVPLQIVLLALTILLVRRMIRLELRFDRPEVRYLLGETVTAAAASAMVNIFYRVSVLIVAIVATDEVTGWFGASFRVIETLVAVPSLLVGAAFPILAYAAGSDRDRLVYAQQRLFEVGVILGAACALLIGIGARPAIEFIAGDEFEPSIAVLQIQGIALAVSFLVTVFSSGLWVLRRQRALVAADAVGLASAIVLTLAFTLAADEQGAALAMVLAEIILAIALGIALTRGHPELRPKLQVVPKVVVATAAAALVWLSPAPEIVEVVVAALVYFGVLAALQGIPPEVRDSLLRRRGPAAGVV